MKINQFPGLFSIGRKDSLWLGYRKMMERWPHHFNFHAKTFVLPEDRAELEKAMEKGNKAFIMKPPNWYCGIGIKLINMIGKSEALKGQSCKKCTSVPPQPALERQQAATPKCH